MHQLIRVYGMYAIPFPSVLHPAQYVYNPISCSRPHVRWPRPSRHRRRSPACWSPSDCLCLPTIGHPLMSVSGVWHCLVWIAVWSPVYGLCLNREHQMVCTCNTEGAGFYWKSWNWEVTARKWVFTMLAITNFFSINRLLKIEEK